MATDVRAPQSRVEKGLEQLTAIIEDARKGADLIEQGLKLLYGSDGEQEEGDEELDEATQIETRDRRGYTPTLTPKSNKNGKGKGWTKPQSVRDHVKAILAKTKTPMTTLQIAQAIVDRGYESESTQRGMQSFTPSVYQGLRMMYQKDLLNRTPEGLWIAKQ